MTDYCLFTIEHQEARQIYIRGIANITEPIEDYEEIIKFYNGSELQSELPPNPYQKGEKEYQLFNELLNYVESEFEEIGNELVFAKTENEFCRFLGKNYYLEMEKVIV